MNRDEYAQMFRLEDTHFWFAARRDLLLRALRQFPPPKTFDAPQGTLFLDVGCGTGGTMDKLAALGEVVGVDVEPLALEFCRTRGHQKLVCASATALPFADNTFGAVVALDVVEHIEKDSTALGEMERVLRPGGLLFLTVPAYSALWSGHDVALMHQRRYIASQIAGLLRESGFQTVHLTYTVSALLPLVWLWRTAQKHFRPNTPPRADVATLPVPVNAVLRGLLGWESRIGLRVRVPFGLTVFAVARKREAPLPPRRRRSPNNGSFTRA